MKEEEPTWTARMGITPDDALRLARELAERVFAPGLCGIPLINRCRDAIGLGWAALEDSQRSVSLHHAIEVSLQERAARRKRTTYEIRNICRRLLRATPDLAAARLRELSGAACRQALERAFHTPQQFAKGRAILHGVFACGVRHGWCAANPIACIPRPSLHEKEVTPLPWAQLLKLLRTASLEPHRSCMAALGVMLWAGVRPAELTRLSWEDIDWQERVISLRPRHSKTGGSRHITLHPPLIAWLRRADQPHRGSLCPPNWTRRWLALRRAAGICQWQQDVLRHTYASYHLKRWHDLPRLQEEMGHRSSRLLRTRYLSMRGVTSCHAQLFWSVGILKTPIDKPTTD